MTKLNDMMIELLREGWQSNATAFTELGSMKLSTRVSDFRKQGIEIEDRIVKRKNRFGRTVQYKEYRLKEATV